MYMKWKLAWDVLGIGIIITSPLVSTSSKAAFRISTCNGVFEEHPADHTRHDHEEHGKNFQETSKDRSCLGMNVTLSSERTLNNHLWKNSGTNAMSQVMSCKSVSDCIAAALNRCMYRRQVPNAEHQLYNSRNTQIRLFFSERERAVSCECCNLSIGSWSVWNSSISVAHGHWKASVRDN